MSMHKIKLTELELSGLEAHKLPIGTPSQNADCFRSGVAWALQSLTDHDADVIAKFTCKLVESGVVDSIENEATGDSCLCVGGILRFANEYVNHIKDYE